MPALINTAASNDVVSQGVSADMAVQFNGNDVSAKNSDMEKRFLGCLLDKICPHHHHEDNCCYEDSCNSSDESCSDSSNSCDSCGGSWSSCSCSSDNNYDPCGSDYSNHRSCDGHSGSDWSDSSSCGDGSSGSGCGYGCSDTNCVHKRSMEVAPPIYNGSDLMLDRREANAAAAGAHVPKTLLGVAAIAAVGAAAAFN